MSTQTNLERDKKAGAAEPERPKTPPERDGAARSGANAGPATQPSAAQREAPEAPVAVSPRADIQDDDAERFAAAYRPSWAPDDPAAPRRRVSGAPRRSGAPGAAPRLSLPPEEAAARLAAEAPVAAARRSSRPSPPWREPEEPAKLALHKRRGSSLAILGSSLLAIGGVFYLSIASSLIEQDDPEIVALRSSRPRAEPQWQPAVEYEPQAEARAPNAVQEPPSIALPEASAPPAATSPIDPSPPVEAPPSTPSPAADLAAGNAAGSAEPAAPPAAQIAPAAPVTAAIAAQMAPADPAITPTGEPSTVPLPADAEHPATADQPVAAEPATVEQPVAAQPAAADQPAAGPAAALAVSAAQPSAAEATRAVATPAPPQERTRFVRLDLAAFPPTTQIQLDGATIANPFNARLPRASRHRVDARAPGYLPQTHMLRMDADARLMIVLKREPSKQGQQLASDAPRPAASRSPSPNKAAPAAPARGAGFVDDNPY